MTTATMTKTAAAAEVKTAKRQMMGRVDWVSDTEGEHSVVKAGQTFYSFCAEDVKAGSRAPVKGDIVFFTKSDSQVFDTATGVRVIKVFKVKADDSMARAEAWVDKRMKMEAERE